MSEQLFIGILIGINVGVLVACIAFIGGGIALLRKIGKL